MKVYKVVMVILLIVMLTVSMVGCKKDATNETNATNATNATNETNTDASTLKDGTYTGQGEGKGGTITVEVTVKDEKIEKIDVVEHHETEGLCEEPLQEIINKVIESNSFNVDAVSGATMTSNGLLEAIEVAIIEAGSTQSGETYSVEADGFHGPVAVEVTIDSGEITDINITSHSETKGIGTKAIDTLPGKIIESQSVAVDGVTGASYTSNAILVAVTKALEEAGADLTKFKSKPEVAKGEDQTVDADVVIVGAGGAGLTAAIEAKTLGAERVVLIEKMAITGGNTRMSGGEFAAPGNRIQLAEGIKEDSAEQLYEDMYKGGYKLGNSDLIRVIADNALLNTEWLRNYVGVKYRDKQSWYGGHKYARTLWPEGDGPVYVDTLQNKAEELGAEIYFLTKAEKLIMDETGRVSGVEAVKEDGSKYTFNAKKGVIITTGGFGANVEMRQKYNKKWPTLDESIPTTNSPAITGDGIVMAEGVGANLVGMEHIQLYPVNNPATGNYYYMDYARLNSTVLLVNKEGKRFVNEKGTRDVISEATLNQTGSMVYELVDATVVKEQDLEGQYAAEIEQCLKQGVLAIGTIDEVSEHFGVPANAVKESIARYNDLVASGTDTDFGRTDNFNPIGEGPYFMFSSVVSVHHTMGGIEIDTEARVINNKGQAIPGLYAAGEVTGGIHGGNRLGSCAVADTVIFGRIAAESCVEGK